MHCFHPALPDYPQHTAHYSASITWTQPAVSEMQGWHAIRLQHVHIKVLLQLQTERVVAATARLRKRRVRWLGGNKQACALQQSAATSATPPSVVDGHVHVQVDFLALQRCLILCKCEAPIAGRRILHDLLSGPGGGWMRRGLLRCRECGSVKRNCHTLQLEGWELWRAAERGMGYAWPQDICAPPRAPACRPCCPRHALPPWPLPFCPPHQPAR